MYGLVARIHETICQVVDIFNLMKQTEKKELAQPLLLKSSYISHVIAHVHN